jgi:adenylate cyclase
LPSSGIDRAAIHDWLVRAALAGATMPALLQGFCERLNATDLTVSRGFVSIETLHPLLRAHSATWERGAVAESAFQYRDLGQDIWRDSPFRHMIRTLTPRLYRLLAGPDARLDYPVLREFSDAGHTAWLALLFGITGDTEAPTGDLGVICSWTTRKPGGWTDAEQADLEELSRTLALAARGSIGPRVTRELLSTYLGRDAGARVTAGDVRRGTVGAIDACLLYADLRGFTDYAESTPPETVVARLNACLDAMGAPVEERGGQILKFLGDGLLAVFMADDGADAADLCAAALDAAEDMLARIAALNGAAATEGAPALAADIALHRGAVLYGNVGTERRLDFTVIGPAVNEAARLEGLCRDLGTHLLVSHSFRAAAGPAQARLVSLGTHRLRGLRDPREVFTLR